MNLKLIECPPFGQSGASYNSGDCWYARDGGHRCRVCGCVWRENLAGSWSLFDTEQVAGVCCDNAVMDLERVWYWWCDNDRTVKPPSSEYAEVAIGHEGKRPMIVVLPSGAAFCLQSPTYRDGKPGPTGWSVDGELPGVTVSPSINYGQAGTAWHWHGWIKAGVMT